MNISRSTRDLIASNKALAEENIRAIEDSTSGITGALSEGFEVLSYELKEISRGISELNATFHWGFSETLAEMGHMNDALSELIKIAKTPAQTAAYEQYEIARDAFRRKLFVECLEALEKAIFGDHVSPGYKLEWRFHQMKGTLHLGFVGGDLSLIDLAKAEDSFVLAARYAKTDFPKHAGYAFLSAGWAAYCQGKMKEALGYTEQSIETHPALGEAFFQAAKVQMALGQVDKALFVLDKAIDTDRFYALKAAGDEDFQRYENRLQGFFEALRNEKYRESMPMVREALVKIRFWREQFPKSKKNKDVLCMEKFCSEGEQWPLFDILSAVQTLDRKILRTEVKAKKSFVLLTSEVADVSRTFEESELVEETYKEEVVIKPGGLFRKKVTEMQARTRTVVRTLPVMRNLKVIRDDIHNGLGELIASIDFCRIPAGKFIVRDSDCLYPVTITRDFYMGKYPVTQAQWEMVVGENPSNFRGDTSLPVERVSWEDCQVFIKTLNDFVGKKVYRLPTEAEWEYACRAGSSAHYCFCDGDDVLDEYAWYRSNSENKTHRVGQKKPNAWGLYDMHGNVYEWVQDWYDDKHYTNNPTIDPQGPSSGSSRVCRGGSWFSNAEALRSAFRRCNPPSLRHKNIGLRLLRIIHT